MAFEGLELFEEVLPGGEEMERRNTRAHGHGSELESPVNDKIGRSISKPSK